MSPNETDPREASLVLAGLVLTDNKALPTFRARRSGNPDVALERFERARDILLAVHRTIATGHPTAWQRLEQAWHLLDPTKADEQDEEAANPSTGNLSVAGATEEAAAPDASPIEPLHLDLPAAEAQRPDPPPPQNSGLEPTTAGKPAPVLNAIDALAGMSPAKHRKDSKAHNQQASASPWAHPIGDTDRNTPSHQTMPQERKAASPWVETEAVGHHATDSKNLSDATSTASTNPKPRPPRRRPAQRTIAIDMDDLPILGGAATPFGLKAPAAEGASKSSPSSDAAQPMPRALPFEKSFANASGNIEVPLLPSHLAAFTVEQHARLCAEREVYKTQRLQVESKHGIQSSEDFKAVDAHFRARMETNLNLIQTWRTAYDEAKTLAREKQNKPDD
jgi:hypothetical protein